MNATQLFDTRLVNLSTLFYVQKYAALFSPPTTQLISGVCFLGNQLATV